MPDAGAHVDLRVERKAHGRGAGRRPVIADLRLVAPPGACVAIMGPSGAGKTTLLRILAGLDRDWVGTRAPIVGRLAMVFQEPRLLPWRTVGQNLALAAPQVGAERIAAELRRCRVDAALFDRHPATLSLGEQRRVALARALVVDPALLVLDEPLVSLDETTAGLLSAVIGETLAAGTTTVVMVEHDLEAALKLCDRLVRLAGSPATIEHDVTLDRPRETRDAVWLAETAAAMRARGF